MTGRPNLFGHPDDELDDRIGSARLKEQDKVKG